jgi:hypothetical protein
VFFNVTKCNGLQENIPAFCKRHVHAKRSSRSNNRLVEDCAGAGGYQPAQSEHIGAHTFLPDQLSPSMHEILQSSVQQGLGLT